MLVKLTSGKSLVAIGLYYQQLPGDTAFSLYFRYKKQCIKSIQNFIYTSKYLILKLWLLWSVNAQLLN
jgi:hypothetical protein